MAVLQSLAEYRSSAVGLIRFYRDLRIRGRRSLDPADAVKLAREGMATRELRLCAALRDAIFGNPKSPYRALFQIAGYNLDDACGVVEREGVEAALGRFRRDGVYVTYAELKGFHPIRRGSQSISAAPSQFDNRLVRGHIPATTAGSRGHPTRIMMDVQHVDQVAVHWSIWLSQRQRLQFPVAFVTPEYPGIVSRQLLCASIGLRMERWFSTGHGGSAVYQLVTAAVHHVARRTMGFPRPTHVALSDLQPVVNWLRRRTHERGGVNVVTSPSTAVRLARTAGDQQLLGVAFLLGGEAATADRLTAIRDSGALPLPTYGFAEGSSVGCQCAGPSAEDDDVHVWRDAWGIIPDADDVDDIRPDVRLLFTGLRSAIPKVLLNAEIGDRAVIQYRSCGCELDSLGYDLHLRQIRSAEKLTGEGVTLLGRDLVPILERDLPSRFGGGPGDYQLAEEQSSVGLPRYTLRVSPEVGKLNDSELIAELYRFLQHARPTNRFMVDQWRQVGALSIRREPPIRSQSGKEMPFVPLGSATQREIVA
jgi:hypothetical protein